MKHLPLLTRIVLAIGVFCALPVSHKVWGEPYACDSWNPIFDLLESAVASAAFMAFGTVAQFLLRRRMVYTTLVDSRLFSVLAGYLVYYGGFSEYSRATKASLASTSPNGRTRVEIVEWTDGRMDRNFFLRLSHLPNGAAETLFNSPDEGFPQTERIIWSSDSSKFLLVGRSFSVQEEGRLRDGQQLYILYDLLSGDVRCNASQQDRYKGFMLSDLQKIAWTENIEQDGAANRSHPVHSGTNQTSGVTGSGR